jgi:DNA-binding MarR family transcriptional regulator
VYVKANDVEPLALRLHHLVEVLRERSGTSALALLEERGVTPAQMKALLVLSHRPEPVSVSELAESLSLSAPSASRTADALSQRGLVERRICTEDRRARDLALTASGRELVERITDARVADLRVVVEGLSPAQRERLRAALSALGLEAPLAA